MTSGITGLFSDTCLWLEMSATLNVLSALHRDGAVAAQCSSDSGCWAASGVGHGLGWDPGVQAHRRQWNGLDWNRLPNTIVVLAMVTQRERLLNAGEQTLSENPAQSEASLSGGCIGRPGDGCAAT